jgi:hypothetical protein
VPLLAGCAALAPVGAPLPATAPGGASATAGSDPVPVPAPVEVRAPLDTTTVSAEGRRVLDAIPEPLAAAERVPPPAPGLELPAPASADDSLRLAVPPPTDGDSAAVPVPTPTLPLGDRPGTLQRALAADSAATPPAPPAAPAAAAPDTCWRVQVAAPAEAARAAALRAAAESQLLVPFVVEREQGRWKVRSSGCLDGVRSESLRRRAALAGFDGVFRTATLPTRTGGAR